jgi:hypothetical protein
MQRMVYHWLASLMLDGLTILILCHKQTIVDLDGWMDASKETNLHRSRGVMGDIEESYDR